MIGLVTFAALIAGLVILEILFRGWHRLRHGRPYFVSLKFAWDDNHVVAHPFLTFAYRKNGVINLNQRLPYALWPDRYSSFKEPLRLNSIGHFGDDLPVGRSPHTLRIACLGSSGVANNIADEIRDHCWPNMLQAQLSGAAGISDRFQSIEVMNCGIGGWTMLDVFIDFAINVIHYKPDYIVLYQGLNDLPLHLMDDYAFDYGHGRRNLGEALHVIKRGYWFPKLPWWHSYECAKDKLVGTGNVRNEVLKCVETAVPDFTRPYRSLVAEENALRNILHLCREHGMRVVIGSYAFFDHSGTLRNRKLREGVDLENAMFEQVTREFDLKFVDLDQIVPKDREHFVDAVHFTPVGMRLVAERIANAVIDDVTQAATFGRMSA